MRSWAILGLSLVLLWAQEEREIARPTAPPPKAALPSHLLQGIVKDAQSGEPLPGAYVRVKGTLAGVVSDAEGRFRLNVLGTPPFTLEASYVGYETAEVIVEKVSGSIEIILQEGGVTMKDVVISTSRVPEAVLEAPVTVSRLGVREIQMGAGTSLFQQLSTFKNVDVMYQSITFPTLNTRGFGGSGNPRFVQRIDGIDMLAPIFGFPVGILSSPSEIDIESAEIIAGPASALYGPNAFNGMLDVYTRTPRRYPGFSAFLRTGVNHIASDTSPQPYFQVALRYARTIGDRFSFKIVGEYLRAVDWLAVDYSDEGEYVGAQGPFRQPGRQNPGYDGVNLYGDEIRILIDPASVNISPPERFYVARTGYRDRDIVNPATFLQKYTMQLQYFITENLEISWRSFVVNGNSIYQAANRNVLRDVLFHQHKLEMRGKRFLARAYGSFENSGRAYDSRFVGIFLNMRSKPNEDWFLSYLYGYNAYGTHEAARIYADTSTYSPITGKRYIPRLQPGTREFQQALEEITSGPYRTQGQAGFYDRSSFYHAELQYDFSEWTKNIADILVGGNLRLFLVNTGGTLYIDYDGPFWTHEYGAFVQANRWLLNRRLRLLASARYDKNKFFQGRVTPRAAILYALGKERQHSLRLSYQTGFRIPTLQDQFIALDIGFGYVSLGGTAPTRKTFGLDRFMYLPSSVRRYQAAARGITDSAALATLAQQYLQQAPKDPVRPEFIQQYEIGGRFQLIKGLYLDIEYARAYYRDFILYRRVISSRPIYEPGTTRPISLTNVDPSTYAGLLNLTNNSQLYTYSTASNISSQVYAEYASLGVEYAITPKILWTASYSYAALVLRVARDPSLLPSFNTPRHKAGSALYFSGFGRWGASLNYRWIDAFDMDGLIIGRVPSVQWVDAQISYNLPQWKTQLRIGAQNALNIRYVQFPGGPRIGALYYFQVTYDPFLR